jgi:hypothetical protein
MRLQSERVLSQHEESGVAEALEPCSTLTAISDFTKALAEIMAKCGCREPFKYEKSNCAISMPWHA